LVSDVRDADVVAHDHQDVGPVLRRDRPCDSGRRAGDRRLGQHGHDTIKELGGSDDGKGSAPEPSAAGDGKKFDIDDYTQAAMRIREATVELQSLLGEVGTVSDSTARGHDVGAGVQSMCTMDASKPLVGSGGTAHRYRQV
jgi:hypothetical protein